jgi:hypothetical protein
LTTSGAQTWHQDSSGIQGKAEKGDLFGWSLAVGDFDRSSPFVGGYDDLAVGVPLEDIGSITNAGMVQVLYGASTGLTSRDQIWHQDISGIKGACEAHDMFGYSLAVGNFDTYYDDLAVGVPYEDIGNITDAGMVQILYGSSGGLTDRDETLYQGDGGLGGGAEAHDRLGWSLATAGFNGQWNMKDLVIGVPYEDLGGTRDAGLVHIVFAAKRGHSKIWHQNTYGVVDHAESNEKFGWSLAVGAITPCPDLAVGVPGEIVYPTGGLPGQGMVNVLYSNR